MSTGSGKQFIRDIIDRIDTVGWTSGSVYRDGNQCIVGAGASLKGARYPLVDEPLGDETSRVYDLENQAAEEIAETIGLPDSRWFSVTGFNDSFWSWEELKADLLSRIDDV